MNELNIINQSRNKNIGLMCAIGNISRPFREKFRYMEHEKICDSGVFSKKRLSHEELFNNYEYVEATYGIILDKYRDIDGTLNNAREAMKIYKSKKYNFNLVGVCQGNTIDEYIKCTKKLISIGYTHIAIGGLLKKVGDRYRVEDESHIEEIIWKIRKFYDGWLFVLGCYSESEKRLELFEKWDIYGADSKQWCFKYKKEQGDRQGQLAEYVKKLGKGRRYIQELFDF